jgi:hypothetical protein
MTKRILLVCSLLSSIQYAGDETCLVKQEVDQDRVKIVFCIEVDKTKFDLKSIEDMIHSNLRTILFPGDIKDTLPENFATLEDCAVGLAYLHRQVCDKSDEFKQEFYKEHVPTLDRIDDFINAELDIRHNQTDCDIEGALLVRCNFYSEIQKDPPYEDKLRLGSTFDVNDSGFRARSALQAVRNRIASLKSNDPYQILLVQQEILTKCLINYQKPDCQHDQFEFKGDLKGCNHEVRVLLKILDKKRKDFPTPLERLTEEYDSYAKKLRELVPSCMGLTSEQQKKAFKELCDYIEQKAVKDCVHEIVNAGFGLGNKFLYPQLLQTLIALRKVTQYITSPVDRLNELMSKMRFPGYGVEDVGEYIRSWIMLITGAAQYSAFNLSAIKTEREMAFSFAAQHEVSTLVDYTQDWIDYVSTKACEFINNGRKIDTVNFFKLPKSLI